jgi:eukaryotic-like serine/threonine-protein kinase
MIGQTISHYTILAKLGEGGMGVVYKAHDTKLDRVVALKFLPPHLSSSADDKARFMQEAKAASSLSHPNVCTIYAIEEFEQRLFIAMEFVEGQTLADRKGAVTTRQAIDIGAQVAEGLAAAHEKGIIHRDIKPENIMIRKDGIAQIMDFGLAKFHTASPASRLTKTGATMGTVGYMSPEQIQGLDVDHRSDIFSLGVVLYELLAGGSPFKGVHESAIMYEIVNVEAQPVSALKEGIDPEVDEIILECLEKDKDDRYQSAKELAKDLRKIRRSSGKTRSRMYSGSVPVMAPSAGTPGSVTAGILNRRFDLLRYARSGILPWILSALLGVALVSTWFLLHARVPEKVVVRFLAGVGNDKSLDVANYSALAISHDGTTLLYKANSAIFLRKMDTMEPVAVPGLENASSPFFSPDDRWVGVFTGGRLVKLALSGGTPTALAEVPDNRGGAWSKEGWIVFGVPAGDGLLLVSENGGAVRRITAIDTTRRERTHRWPSLLPDGKHVLFTVGKLSSPDYYENATIDVVNAETGERKTLLKDASSARYINSGHLLFSRAGVLYAVRFDAERLALTGEPVPVIRGVCSDLTTGAPDYVVSDNGTLAYVPGAVEGQNRKIVRIDMRGETAIVDSIGRRYLEPRLSPDNKKVAVVIANGEDNDIWICDLGAKTQNRLTFGGFNRTPHWSSDGKTIAFMKRTETGGSAIVLKPCDGSGDEREIYRVDRRLYVNEWTRDGENLIIDDLNASNSISNLFVIPLSGKKTPWYYSHSQFDEYEASLSPNGKWLAYLSNEAGSYQIYVRSFPGKEGKWQISTDVAEEPRWSPDGKTLYYRKGSQLIAVPVSTVSTFSVGAPKVLFNGFPSMNVDSGISYDLTSDGRFFITTSPIEATSLKAVSVICNWTEELRRLTMTEK